MQRLTTEEIDTLDARLPMWTVNATGTALERSLSFAGFDEAMRFINNVADLARAQDHHPEWTNSYNRVHIRLTTHDAQGLTGRDLKLAEAIDAVVAASGTV